MYFGELISSPKQTIILFIYSENVSDVEQIKKKKEKTCMFFFKDCLT